MAVKVPDTRYWQESWGFLKEQSAKDEAKRQKVSRFSGIVMQRDAVMGNGHNCTNTWNSCGCCPEGCAAKIVRHACARVAASYVADIVAAEVFEIPSLLRKGYGSVSGAPAVSKDFCLALLVVPPVAACCKKFATQLVQDNVHDLPVSTPRLFLVTHPASLWMVSMGAV